MSNWLENFQPDNSDEQEIISTLELFKASFPEEKNTIEELISLLRREPLSDDLLFEIREKLRRIISKDEHNLIRKKDKISKIIKKISGFRSGDNKNYDFEDCFFDGYDFKTGDDYYYLKFPSLHEKVDGNIKSELLLDRYIKDFIKSSLSDYQLNRQNFEQFETYSLIIIHHLRADSAALIDTDNLEIKKPIDAINKVLIKNDTAESSHIFQIVEVSEEEFTEMYVIKGHGLGKSILDLLNSLK